MAEMKGWPGMLCFPQVATKTDITAEQCDLGLQNVSSLSLPEYSFQLTPSDLFSDL